MLQGGELRLTYSLDCAEHPVPTCGHALIDLNYRVNLLDADIRHLLNVEPVTHGISTMLKSDQVRRTVIRDIYTCHG